MALFDTIRLGASGAGDDYEVERSLRFNASDSPNLSRTFGTNSSNTTKTLSFWVKRAKLGAYQSIASATANGFIEGRIQFINTDELQFTDRDSSSGSTDVQKITTRKFRDTGAWYHIVLALDSTQSTADDRVKLYINGVRETSFSSSTNPASSYAFSFFNSNAGNFLGVNTGSSDYFGGYLAEINFCDGQFLDPSSFGETKATTGQWIPKDTSALTFGTNGFRLKFADNSNTTATTLGKDSSGNSNNFTPSNFSVSAGQGNDCLEDTPTNNFCTLNPLAKVTNGNVTLSNGNLDAAFGSVSGGGGIGSSFVVRSGKWYWEITMTADSGGACHIGVLDQKLADYSGVQYYEPGLTAESYSYQTNGTKYNNNSNTSYGASYTTNDVIGVKLDLDNGTIEFLKNNSSQGTAFTGLTGGFTPAIGDGNSAQTHSIFANFGQQAFTYSIPSGFSALSSVNLPDPTILLPNKHFDTLLFAGTGNSGRSVTGLEFQPDWFWGKSRSAAFQHILYDSVRGTGTSKSLSINQTNPEGHNSSHSNLTSFDSGGVTFGATSSTDILNYSGGNSVGWFWNAGGSTTTNNDGSISAQVRANTTSGFSIVSYVGNGSNSQTVGHGLGVSPDLVILKDRDSNSVTGRWTTIHSYDTSKNLEINTNSVAFGHQGFGSITALSSTTFTLFGSSNTNTVNESGDNYIAYVFSEVEGYSKFGKFKGNGNTDGRFVYTGFRPAWVLIKNTQSSKNWGVFDNKRVGYNGGTHLLQPSDTAAEDTGQYIEFYSNGFKIITTALFVNNNYGI